MFVDTRILITSLIVLQSITLILVCVPIASSQDPIITDVKAGPHEEMLYVKTGDRIIISGKYFEPLKTLHVDIGEFRDVEIIDGGMTDENGDFTTTVLMPLMDDGLHYLTITVWTATQSASTTRDFSVDNTPPPPPTLLSAVYQDWHIMLEWTESSSAIAYNIYKSELSGGPYEKVDSTEAQVEEKFAQDLENIVVAQPDIVAIHYFTMSPSSFKLTIEYSDGLSDTQKVSIQNWLQSQLESKWYIRYVHPNYIICPVDVFCPPWPGFAIGELLIGLGVEDSIITGTKYQDTVKKCDTSYYYIVTAYDMVLNESQPSNEIMVEVPNITLGDVSGNGKITVYDAVFVIQYVVGLTDLEILQQQAADVTNDNTVTAMDAALILQHTVGLITQFPAQGAPILAAKNQLLANTIAELENVSLTIEQKRALEQVKHSIKPLSLPSKTALRQNYPNPFNPDTWLPYQLSDDSSVVIRIYDVKGWLIRILDLGHQKAGYYLTRSKAAYWDGKDAAGQGVSNGVYFYHLQTDDFSSVRKTVILK